VTSQKRKEQRGVKGEERELMQVNKVVMREGERRRSECTELT